jgi:hypothetical protein
MAHPTPKMVYSWNWCFRLHRNLTIVEACLVGFAKPKRKNEDGRVKTEPQRRKLRKELLGHLRDLGVLSETCGSGCYMNVERVVIIPKSIPILSLRKGHQIAFKI